MIFRSLEAGALDVFANEPPDDSPLLGAENIVFTPHLGASTREAQVAVNVLGALIGLSRQEADLILVERSTP